MYVCLFVCLFLFSNPIVEEKDKNKTAGTYARMTHGYTIANEFLKGSNTKNKGARINNCRWRKKAQRK